MSKLVGLLSYILGGSTKFDQLATMHLCSSHEVKEIKAIYDIIYSVLGVFYEQ
jgi:hypothetical protein